MAEWTFCLFPLARRSKEVGGLQNYRENYEYKSLMREEGRRRVSLLSYYHIEGWWLQADLRAKRN